MARADTAQKKRAAPSWSGALFLALAQKLLLALVQKL